MPPPGEFDGQPCDTLKSAGLWGRGWFHLSPDGVSLRGKVQRLRAVRVARGLGFPLGVLVTLGIAFLVQQMGADLLAHRNGATWVALSALIGGVAGSSMSAGVVGWLTRRPFSLDLPRSEVEMRTMGASWLLVWNENGERRAVLAKAVGM